MCGRLYRAIFSATTTNTTTALPHLGGDFGGCANSLLMSTFPDGFIPAQHHPLATKFYEWVGKIGTNIFFRGWEIEMTTPPPIGKSVLLIGNHVSWWDGFWGLRMCNELFHKQFHVMMLENNLRDSRILRHTGAFSVQPGSRSAFFSLQYAAQLLDQPGNLLLMYPQGRIQSVYEQEIRFEPGIKRLAAAAAEKNCEIWFYAALMDYSGHPRPLATIRIEKASAGEDVAAGYSKFYSQCLERQKDRVLADHQG